MNQSEDTLMREMNVSLITEFGFRTSPTLPLPFARSLPGTLRPLREIAGRLLALDCAFTWVAYAEDVVASERIVEYRQRNNLDDYLLDIEIEILNCTRTEAEDKFVSENGWRLEHIWCLAWVLGYAHQPFFQGREIPQEHVNGILNDFLPGLEGTVDDLLDTAEPRDDCRVRELEDLFYLVHNASRSASLGEDTVPENFCKFTDARAIHERRHALTWAISPGVEWTETDLST